jgi:hypothetical protein
MLPDYCREARQGGRAFISPLKLQIQDDVVNKIYLQVMAKEGKFSFKGFTLPWRSLRLVSMLPNSVN